MLAQFALHGRLVELLSSSSPCSVFVELSLWRGSLYILRGSLASQSFVFVLLLAIGGLCGLALLTRDLKFGSGEIRERRSQLKNGVRIQTRKPKLGTIYLAALFPWHGLAALPRNGCALLLRVVEAVLLRHIVALLVPNHVARLRWHVLALLSLHLRFGAACICPFLCLYSYLEIPVQEQLRTFGWERCGRLDESWWSTVA